MSGLTEDETAQLRGLGQGQVVAAVEAILRDRAGRTAPAPDPAVNAAGVVLARKSYEHLLRTRDRALREVEWQRDQIASTERWAHKAFDEQRRLQDRLTQVVAAAASLGVSIDAINAALAAAAPATPTPPAPTPADTGGRP